MSGGGVEAGTESIQEILGEVRSGYPGDKGGACSSGGGGRDGYGIFGGRGRLGSGRMKGGE